MLGTGNALLYAKPWINREPVVVAYPDDLCIGNPPLSLQLIKLYEKTGKNIISIIENPENINRYGVIDLYKDEIHVKTLLKNQRLEVSLAIKHLLEDFCTIMSFLNI